MVHAVRCPPKLLPADRTWPSISASCGNVLCTRAQRRTAGSLVPKCSPWSSKHSIGSAASIQDFAAADAVQCGACQGSQHCPRPAAGCHVHRSCDGLAVELPQVESSGQTRLQQYCVGDARVPSTRSLHNGWQLWPWSNATDGMNLGCRVLKLEAGAAGGRSSPLLLEAAGWARLVNC